ncbi:MAG TPA: DUF6256 family protein [Actinomycetota bacterium]|nr:DUF6256 family protein [Actinomycetota bacterium]
MVRDVVLPVLVPLGLFGGMVASAARSPVPRPVLGGRPPPFGRHLLGHVAKTLAGGYAAFVLIVIAFEVGVVPDSLGPALLGGAFLAVISGGTFLLLSWVEWRLRSRRSRC